MDISLAPCGKLPQSRLFGNFAQSRNLPYSRQLVQSVGRESPEPYFVGGLNECFHRHSMGVYDFAHPDFNEGDAVPYTGDVAVYRLLNVGHLYTTDCNEAQTLVREHWAYEGVQCCLSSAGTPGLVPLYRLSGVGMHFYTADSVEKDNAVAGGWVLEGIMGYVSPAPTADTVALYRALNPGNIDHFYTTDQAEFNNAVAGGWTGEGITGYVSNQTTLSCAALKQALSDLQSDKAHYQAYLDCLNNQGSGIFGFLGLIKTIFVDQNIVGADADAIWQAINQGAGCEAFLTPDQQARLQAYTTRYMQALNARNGGALV